MFLFCFSSQPSHDWMSAREWRNRMNCYQGMYQKRRLATWMASNRNLSDYNGAHPKILGESPPSFSPATEEGLLLFGRILVGPNPSIHLYVCFFFILFSFFFVRPRVVNLRNNSNNRQTPAEPSKVFAISTPESILSCRFFMHGRL